jgi:hypothetical protein
MKAKPILLKLIISASLIKTAAGLHCSSDCAACWKTGSTVGEDAKMSCFFGECGHKCPQGYENIHCAKHSRCQYVGFCEVETTAF